MFTTTNTNDGTETKVRAGEVNYSSSTYTSGSNHGTNYSGYTATDKIRGYGHCLELSKAKFLGAHTVEYSLDLTGYGNKTIYINWSKD